MLYVFRHDSAFPVKNEYAPSAHRLSPITQTHHPTQDSHRLGGPEFGLAGLRAKLDVIDLDWPADCQPREARATPQRSTHDNALRRVYLDRALQRNP
jgi:hypothetical protein